MDETQVTDQNIQQQQQGKKYHVRLDDIFEGPLNLLLELIKNSEMNIFDIPIARITEQYLEYLSLLIVLDLENLSEFVEMAATLVYIKSKMMLPVEVEYEEDEFDPREELIAKLLEYQKYKLAAGVLEQRTEEHVPFIEKDEGPVLFKGSDDEKNWKPLSILDLLNSFAQVLKSTETEEAGLQITKIEFTVEEKIEYFKDLLTRRESFNYFEFIRPHMNRIELVCTFLAILELVKKGYIAIVQHVIFGDILISRKGVPPVEQQH